MAGLQAAQADVYAWSSRNFGDPVKIKGDVGQVLRLMAALGKAAHAMLKLSQGIRGTPEEHRSNFTSALIELQQIATTTKVFDTAGSVPVNVSALIGMIEELGETCTAALAGDKAEVEDGLADLLVYNLDFHARNGLDAEAAFNKTWAKVRERDWKKNAKDGSQPAPQ